MFRKWTSDFSIAYDLRVSEGVSVARMIAFDEELPDKGAVVVEEYNEDTGDHGREILAIGEMAACREYGWDGNVETL
jgi:hypothetical protein